jgi:branched-subunit amino acid aminotransferase/4-amino-4-deoxychorismate lyase
VTRGERMAVKKVDKIAVADGKPGPVTRLLQKEFFDIVQNGNDPHGWLKFVYND